MFSSHTICIGGSNYTKVALAKQQQLEKHKKQKNPQINEIWNKQRKKRQKLKTTTTAAAAAGEAVAERKKES